MTQQSNGNNLVVQGRIVWILGRSLFEGKQKTRFGTNELIIGNDGNTVNEYGFGVAIAKIDPATGQNSEEFTNVWNTLHNEAFTLYPNGQIPPGFSMKFKDGDTIDDKGKPFADREGYAGHIILSCTTQIPIKYFKFEGGNNILVNTGIKNGDYVNVQLNVKAHPAIGQGKSGLYMNPSAVQLIQEGKEIINTPSGDQIFGQAAPAYSGQVVAGQAPTMPGQAAPVAPPVQAPIAAPGIPAHAPPAANPHYQVLPENLQPQMQPQAPLGNVPPAQPVAQVPTAPSQMPATQTSLVNGSVPTAYRSEQVVPPMPTQQ